MAIVMVMAPVPFSMLMVMAAVSARTVFQSPCKKSLDGLVGIARHSGVHPDPVVGEGVDGTHPDASAHKRVDGLVGKQTGKRPVSLSVGRDNLAVDDLPVLDRIDLERLGVSEVLEHEAIIICDCDSHGINLRIQE